MILPESNNESGALPSKSPPASWHHCHDPRRPQDEYLHEVAREEANQDPVTIHRTTRNPSRKQVTFSSRCNMVVFPKLKKKYGDQVWYQQEDFDSFKENTRRLVEILRQRQKPCEATDVELHEDCFVLGLENLVSQEEMRVKMQSRISAYDTVFRMQEMIFEEGYYKNNDEESPPVNDFQNTDLVFSSWEALAFAYGETAAKSKVHAYIRAMASYYDTVPSERHQHHHPRHDEQIFSTTIISSCSSSSRWIMATTRPDTVKETTSTRASIPSSPPHFRRARPAVVLSQEHGYYRRGVPPT